MGLLLLEVPAPNSPQGGDALALSQTCRKPSLVPYHLTVVVFLFVFYANLSAVNWVARRFHSH